MRRPKVEQEPSPSVSESGEDEREEGPGLAAGLVSSIVLFAASRGADLESIRDAAQIPFSALLDPDARVPQAVLVPLLRFLHSGPLRDEASLGLGRALPLGSLGTVVKILRSSPDLRTFLELSVANSDLINDSMELTFSDKGEVVELRSHHEYDEVDGGVGVELFFALSARVMMTDFGGGLIREIRFRHEQRGELEVYEQTLGAPVTFGARANVARLDPAALERANLSVRASPRLLVEMRLAEYRRHEKLESGPDFAEVRAVIARQLGVGELSVGALAARLGTSGRTLQRRLSASGTHVAALVDRVREELALGLLADEGLSIAQVGERLGFAGERGFRRAFERWTDTTPARARREILKRLRARG